MALNIKAAPYSCPMHPEIVHDEPGDCLICGMALKRRTTSDDNEDVEIRDMTLRFWVSAVLAFCLLLLSISRELLGLSLPAWFDDRSLQWLHSPRSQRPSCSGAARHSC